MFKNYTIYSCDHRDTCKQVYIAKRRAKRLAILAFVGWSLLAAKLVFSI